MLKKLPYPIAGLMLGLAALGNVVMPYGAHYRYALGALSFAILILLVAKVLSNPLSLKEAFEQPVIASVLPTFSMGLALLSVYIRPSLPTVAKVAWFVALFVHIMLMVLFSARYVLRFNIKQVFPSWFIVYVGIACFSVTAPAFGQLGIGRASFWFAFISYFVLLPIAIYRVAVIKEVPPPALPTLVIFTAPSSLALAGYLNSFSEKNVAIVSLLTVCTLISLAGVITQMPRLLKLPFFPSYSAFTFPFVITTIALKGASRFGIGAAFLPPVVTIFELWSVMMVLYVLWRYASFLIAAPPGAKAPVPVQPAP